jgi:hypothetical protein
MMELSTRAPKYRPAVRFSMKLSSWAKELDLNCGMKLYNDAKVTRLTTVTIV